VNSADRWLPFAVAGLAVIVFSVAAYFVVQTPSSVLPESGDAPVSPTQLPDTVTYSIEEGQSAADIGRDLETLGVIRSGRQFESLVKLMGVGDRLSAGDYVFHVGAPVPSVVQEIIVKAAVPVIRVTFPEGIRIEEMAALAEEAGFGTAEEFLAAAEVAQLPPGLAEALPPTSSLPEGQRLQGYLFPDTYIRPVGFTAEQLVRLMIETMDEKFTLEMRTAAAARGLTTHQVLTLAAIVEREAVLAEERPRIAGVFYNRLKAGDILGADPTAQYAASLDPESVALYGYWKRELTQVDLDNPSPYNTRENAGLPPGPITNPSLASIEAVVYPEDTDYYYFVANAVLADGSHVFAVTEAEHDLNKLQYGAGAAP